MLAITRGYDVGDPLRITLFAAGAAYFGALVITDPHRGGRLRTLGIAAAVSIGLLILTVWLAQLSVWAAAALLVVLMYLSYALLAVSPRAATVVFIGAITTFVSSNREIETGRIGWFVLAMAVGFAWLALWESLLSPEGPADDLDAHSAATPSTSGGGLVKPTTALAIQAAVAAVAAGLVAELMGNDQTLIVAWTAFLVIGASAGASTRRAWGRLYATVFGAVAGVLIAASVPDTAIWTIAVVAVGVFFTIFTAPVSYPAMVFWLNIALVPLFATDGLYFALIRDKAVAALIGGCVAAVVALTVLPIRE